MSQPDSREIFEISPRFRRVIEQRILQLERDADTDEAHIGELGHADHIHR